MIRSLPPKDSSSLALVHPTASEQHTQILNNSKIWRGALALDPYVRREQHLANVKLTMEGGITFWILVDTAENVPEGSDRTVLAGCETLRKRALVAHHGQVENVICHGVASVFSAEEFRGRGYGARMMEELGKRLETWQGEQGRSYLSILYSDIGKRFYTKHHWRPYASSHMQLPPLTGTASVTVRLPQSTPLTASDLPPLCALDEELLSTKLAKLASSGSMTKPAVAIIPDAAVMAWHHAREDFVAKELFGRVPPIKGAQVLIPCPASPTGRRRAWGIWTRMWHNTDLSQVKDNTLHLLRLCIEPAPGDYELESNFVEDTQAVMTILSQAQRQAAEWAMQEVEVWNPAPAMKQAVKLLAQDWSTQGGKGVGEKWGVLVDRDAESICSLRWYGEKQEGDTSDGEVDWLESEKFAWN